MKKIISIVGLPASGKTYKANEINDGSYFLFDDMSNNFCLLSEAKNYNKIIITDPYFCLYSKVLISNKINQIFGECEVDFIAFENNLVISYKNCLIRNTKNISYSFINHLSEKYNTLEYKNVIPIYNLEKEKL